MKKIFVIRFRFEKLRLERRLFYLKGMLQTLLRNLLEKRLKLKMENRFIEKCYIINRIITEFSLPNVGLAT